MEQTKYIIDFDSTFTKVEALDELVLISQKDNPNINSIFEGIQSITNQAMNGAIPFDQALEERLKLLNAGKVDIEVLIEVLKNKVSNSFQRQSDFLKNYAEDIYIVSGGFKEYILPVVVPMGILPEHVYANEFVFNEKEMVIGFDKNNLLSQPKGKVLLLKQLQLHGDIRVIGDGYTDYELKEAGLANSFFMFTENITRDVLLDKADQVVHSLDEFLYLNNLETSRSYPKNKIKVLLLENIHPNAMGIYNEEGYDIEAVFSALDEKELIEKINGVHILGIRSKTQITNNVIEAANRLISIGAFCIGTNQIDTEACANNGIAVFNAPYSNTRSVVELTIGEIIMLLRNAIDKSNKMHQGIWDKSANNSFEIRGKKIGIIGFGNIGAQLSVLAESLGMKVYFYDIADKLALGNAKKCNSLNQLLNKVDIVSVHVDGREANTNFINAEAFAQMKTGTIFINNARGHVVDMEALKKAILDKHIIGAAIDVFAYEPKSNEEEFMSELRGLSNVILTPHIGGSTEEAQANIGEFVPQKIINYINKGDTYGAVNFPEVQLPSFENAHRFLHIHKNVPGILAQINNSFAKHNVNINAQYLKTNEQIGYVITDVATNYDDAIIDELKSIQHTIKFRMLY
jgi:D-3-phosphoglycerate dehydrogenase / 2-oxoglutarate reductase